MKHPSARPSARHEAPKRAAETPLGRAGLFASGAAAFGLSLGVGGEAKALPAPGPAPARDDDAQSALRARELLVVDGRLAYAAALARGARASVEALILDPSRDGVAQIAEALRGRRDVRAVHVVAHGAPGRIALGATELSSSTLAAHRDALTSWFGDVPPYEQRPDVLLYGCSAGAGDEGARFLAALAAVTGADVAASDDLTGATSAGGDFALEVATGAIEAGFPVSLELAESVITTTLDTFTVTSAADAGPGTLRQAVLYANALAGVDTIVFDLPPGDAGGPPVITLTTGALAIEEAVEILGPGADALAIDGNASSRIFTVGDATVSPYGVYFDGIPGETIIEGLTLRNGSDTTDRVGGGAVMTFESELTIDSCVITGSTSTREGGGVFAYYTTLRVLYSTVEGNASEDYGGGIAGYGTTEIVGSTISGNTAEDDGGGAVLAGDGAYVRDSLVVGNEGAFEGGGIVADAARTEIVNSTVSGNVAGLLGGGVHADFGLVRIESSTVANNVGEGEAIYAPGTPYEEVYLVPSGGVTVDSRATLVLRDAIVHGNTGGTGVASASPVPMDVRAEGLLIGDRALVGVLEGEVLDVGGVIDVGQDPLLLPLADNGGPTRTHALGEGSPALDRGTNPRDLAFDQRGAGFARVSGAAADLGAFEVQVATVPDAGVDGGTGGPAGGSGCGCEVAGPAPASEGPKGLGAMLAAALGALTWRRGRSRNRGDRE